MLKQYQDLSLRKSYLITESKMKSLLSEDKTITIKCTDLDDTLENMLNHIKSNVNVGHSFDIIVDPTGDKDERRSFGWDGDGMDYISDISVENSDKE